MNLFECKNKNHSESASVNPCRRALQLWILQLEGRVPLGAKSVFGERWGELMADGEGSWRLMTYIYTPEKEHGTSHMMLGRWISFRDTACFQGRTVELQECNDLMLVIWWWFVNLTEGNLIWWFLIWFTVPEQTLGNPLSYPHSSFGFSGVLNVTQFIELLCVWYVS